MLLHDVLGIIAGGMGERVALIEGQWVAFPLHSQVVVEYFSRRDRRA